MTIEYLHFRIFTFQNHIISHFYKYVLGEHRTPITCVISVSVFYKYMLGEHRAPIACVIIVSVFYRYVLSKHGTPSNCVISVLVKKRRIGKHAWTPHIFFFVYNTDWKL